MTNWRTQNRCLRGYSSFVVYSSTCVSQHHPS